MRILPSSYENTVESFITTDFQSQWLKRLFRAYFSSKWFHFWARWKSLGICNKTESVKIGYEPVINQFTTANLLFSEIQLY